MVGVPRQAHTGVSRLKRRLVGVAEPGENESWLIAYAPLDNGSLQKPRIVGSDFLPLQTPKFLLYSVPPPWFCTDGG